MERNGATTEVLLARLDALATQVERQEAELARLRGERGRAGPSIAVEPAVTRPAATGRRSALRRMLVAGAGAVGLLAAAREPGTVEATARGTIVGNSTAEYGLAALPGTTNVGDFTLGAQAGLVGLTETSGNPIPLSLTGAGVIGMGNNNLGVLGISVNAFGVLARSTNNDALLAFTEHAQKAGVVGANNSQADRATGVRGFGRIGVFGSSGDPALVEPARVGVFGKSEDFVGVQGDSQESFGVFGRSLNGVGVRGETQGTNAGAVGVVGQATAGGGIGVKAQAASGGVGLEVVGKARFSTAGNSSINAGQASKAVANPNVTATSFVGVTLMGDPGNPLLGVRASPAWVQRQPGTGFTVHLTRPAANATPFAYFIVEPGSG